MTGTKANSTSFKAIPRIKVSCPECSIVFEKREKERLIFCSVACSNIATRRKRFISQSRENKCLELAKQNKTIKEISEITGYPQGSVASYLNKAKFRKRKDGTSYQTQLNNLKKVYKKCEICEFDRIVEICHIIPASKGGDISEENTIGLCPNHHHLFDHRKLTVEEAVKLKVKVTNYLDYVKKVIVKKNFVIMGVDNFSNEIILVNKRSNLKQFNFDPSVIDKVLKKQYKQASNKNWYRYTVFKPEISK